MSGRIDCIRYSGGTVIDNSGDEVVCPTVSVIMNEDEMDAMGLKMKETESATLDTLSCDDIARNEAQKLKENAVSAQSAVLHQCDEENECSAAAFNDGGYYECTGTGSCKGVDFDNVGAAWCRGKDSCQNADMEHGVLECSGAASCKPMNIKKKSPGDMRVDCNGYVCSKRKC